MKAYKLMIAALALATTVAAGSSAFADSATTSATATYRPVSTTPKPTVTYTDAEKYLLAR